MHGVEYFLFSGHRTCLFCLNFVTESLYLPHFEYLVLLKISSLLMQAAIFRQIPCFHEAEKKKKKKKLKAKQPRRPQHKSLQQVTTRSTQCGGAQCHLSRVVHLPHSRDNFPSHYKRDHEHMAVYFLGKLSAWFSTQASHTFFSSQK